MVFSSLFLVFEKEYNMNTENSFSGKVGQFVANILVGCIGACLSACAVALTVRFIIWMF